MFYPKCLNNSNIYTIIIARSNKKYWIKSVYVVGFFLIKFIWNKSYGELRFYVRFRGVFAIRRRLFAHRNIKNLLLFIKSNSNNFILFRTK